MGRCFRFVALTMVGAGLLAEPAPPQGFQEDLAYGRGRGRAIQICEAGDASWFPHPPVPHPPRPRRPRPFLSGVLVG